MISKLIESAAKSAPIIAKQSGAMRNRALIAIAEAMHTQKSTILSVNEQEVLESINLDSALRDRLILTEKSFSHMLESLHNVATLPDPIGCMRDISVRPSGIRLGKMRVPLGVVGMIYESRPNVTQEAAALCIKSGNVCILRGGSEALQSNLAIYDAICNGLRKVGLPENIVCLMPTADRSAVSVMLQSPFIDVLIPRGGKSLIEKVTLEARMPVIKHLDGNCHVYVDEGANLNMAVRIADNAKTQRYSTCNTMESLLVHEAIAEAFLPLIANIYTQKGVAMRACPRACKLISQATPATEDDWTTEYLAPIIAIRVVPHLEEAILHINTYGSHHTDAIVSENYHHVMQFIREVDSASVIINASTRFADGFEYGLGAEIGISTDKFHVRGPVGLEGLTSEKWIVMGEGEIRH